MSSYTLPSVGICRSWNAQWSANVCTEPWVKLQSTATEEARVAWKVYHESITLIVAVGDDGSSDTHLFRLLDNVFYTMVLLIGLDDLISVKNVERLKRDLKCCYKLFDTLLADTDFFGSITESVDVLISPENNVLQVNIQQPEG
ncbi:protein fuzzy homolog [Ptychodera flava]|uniref:protein fuzzy homolog n=1 Tax=Ptychodera flava TaxID=63121 RepID=UPI00396A28C0